MRRDRHLRVGVGRDLEVSGSDRIGGRREGKLQRDFAFRSQRGHDLAHIDTLSEVGVNGRVRLVQAPDLVGVEAGGGRVAGSLSVLKCKPRSGSKRHRRRPTAASWEASGPGHGTSREERRPATSERSQQPAQPAVVMFVLPR